MRNADLVRRSLLTGLILVAFYWRVWPIAAEDQKALAPTRVDAGPPKWLGSYAFKKKFTFVRLKYQHARGRPGWATDYPDADINFSKRLKQLTTLDVAPNGLVLDPADPKLDDYPFAYLSCNSNNWELSDAQVTALRQYLENGGFLMIDDSWGADEHKNIVSQMKKVLPNHAPQELPLQHKIFHCVFDLTEKPQVYSIHHALRARQTVTDQKRDDTFAVSYQGITNDDGRLMVLICHNTDLADGWERVDDDPWYAREFSEKRAFPMGINVVFYALTASD